MNKFKFEFEKKSREGGEKFNLPILKFPILSGEAKNVSVEEET